MTDQVEARQGKVHVCISSDSVEGDLIEEYTPTAAREFAAELLAAAGQAEQQQQAIEAACAEGHDWNDGANWGDGENAYTVWRCQREGCPARREEKGHHVDDSEAIANLLAALPPDDELGRILLDFDGMPVLTVMGMRLTREDRIDAATSRAAMSKFLRQARRELAIPSPSVLNGPFGTTVHVDPAMPAGTLMAVGSCVCEHPVSSHGPTGCTVHVGPTTRCQCETPITKLAVVVKNIAPQ